MSDYISREAAIEAIDCVDWYHQAPNKDMVHGANSSEHQAWYKEQDVYAALNGVPAADVRPVVRTEFVRCGDGKGVPYMCSHCGRTTPANMVEIWGVNFCPNCGADMRES